MLLLVRVSGTVFTNRRSVSSADTSLASSEEGTEGMLGPSPSSPVTGSLSTPVVGTVSRRTVVTHCNNSLLASHLYAQVIQDKHTKPLVLAIETRAVEQS